MYVLLLLTLYCEVYKTNIYSLAEGPGVTSGKKISNFFLAYNPSRPPMSVHKKIQTNRSTAAVWPAIRNIYIYIYIFECLVLKKQILNCLFPGTLFAAKTDYTVVPKVCMLNVFYDANNLRDCSDTGWAEFNMSVAFYLWSMQLLTFLSNYWISQ